MRCCTGCCWSRTGKGRLGPRLTAAAVDAGEQRVAGRCLLQTDEIVVHHGAEQALWPHLSHAHRHQFPALAGRVLNERGGPLCFSEAALQVPGREHRDGPLRLAG
jgi:hypothetical protein